MRPLLWEASLQNGNQSRCPETLHHGQWIAALFDLILYEHRPRLNFNVALGRKQTLAFGEIAVLHPPMCDLRSWMPALSHAEGDCRTLFWPMPSAAWRGIPTLPTPSIRRRSCRKECRIPCRGTAPSLLRITVSISRDSRVRARRGAAIAAFRAFASPLPVRLTVRYAGGDRGGSLTA
jgi:hypothetical protein